MVQLLSINLPRVINRFCLSSLREGRLVKQWCALTYRCKDAMAQDSLTLNTGAKMPTFGLGTWLSKPGEVGAAVEAALRGGYKLIDCAHIYGNEAEIGEAFQKCFDEGVVKREEIFITSKLWNADHEREGVVAACELTLKNLKLDYLDLYLIHWPQALKKGANLKDCTDEEKFKYSAEAISETWKGMEECAEKGLTKAIGISNFTITKTENLLKTAAIVPAVNQVECHPYFQQQKLKEYCDSKGIVFEAYSPLGNPARPFKTDAEPVVLEDPVIKEISEKKNVTPAQVCIAFAIHRGMVVIPKTVNLTRVAENFKSTEVKLDAEDMRQLRDIDKNCRLLTGNIFFKEGQTEEEFWDAEEDKKFEVTEPESKRQRKED